MLKAFEIKYSKLIKTKYAYNNQTYIEYWVDRGYHKIDINIAIALAQQTIIISCLHFTWCKSYGKTISQGSSWSI